MPKKTVKQAMLDAADWFERNPDKHIQLNLMRTAKGNYTMSPQHASCFCALGRIGKELGVTTEEFNKSGMMAVHQAMSDRSNGGFSLHIETIYKVNDLGMPGTIEFPNGDIVIKGNPDVVPFLRKLAERLPA